MAKRKVRKAKTRKMKTHKRKTHKMKSHKRKTKTHKMKSRKVKRTSKKMKRGVKKEPSLMKSMIANKKAHWEAYKNLQKRCDKAWAKFRADTKRKARPEILTRDQNHLLLLLGECDYMARECMRMEARRRRG